MPSTTICHASKSSSPPFMAGSALLIRLEESFSHWSFVHQNNFTNQLQNVNRSDNVTAQSYLCLLSSTMLIGPYSKEKVEKDTA